MDNCFTKFPNGILDAALGYRFSAIQLTAVLYVVRMVNGWGKPSDKISVTKMAKDTGFSRRAMVGAVGDLEKMGVLSVERSGAGRVSEMRVNNPEEWDKPVNGASHVNGSSQGTELHRDVNGTSHLPVNGASQEPVNGGSHTKERKERKDINSKKEPSAPVEDDDEGWQGESWGEW